MTIGEYRQKSTKKNARELLLLSDVMVPDMVVIFTQITCFNYKIVHFQLLH